MREVLSVARPSRPSASRPTRPLAHRQCRTRIAMYESPLCYGLRCYPLRLACSHPSQWAFCLFVSLPEKKPPAPQSLASDVVKMPRVLLASDTSASGQFVRTGMDEAGGTLRCGVSSAAARLGLAIWSARTGAESPSPRSASTCGRWRLEEHLPIRRRSTAPSTGRALPRASAPAASPPRRPTAR